MIVNRVYDKYFWIHFLNVFENRTYCRRNNHTQYQLRYNVIQIRFCKSFIKMYTLSDLGTSK